MSGTLRERPAKSGRWELRAYVGRDAETGKPRQVPRVFRGGKRDAVKALDALVHEVSEGQHIGVSATFGKLLDEWMDKVIKKRRARSTVDTYGMHVEKWIRPALGDKALAKLTAHDLDTYFGELEDKGLAGGTIKLQHAIIRSALSQAEAWEWIKGNPPRDPGRSSASEMRRQQSRSSSCARSTSPRRVRMRTWRRPSPSEPSRAAGEASCAGSGGAMLTGRRHPSGSSAHGCRDQGVNI